jgi:hypothetical protein
MASNLDLGPLQTSGTGPGPDLGPIQAAGGASGNIAQTATLQINVDFGTGVVGAGLLVIQTATLEIAVNFPAGGGVNTQTLVQVSTLEISVSFGTGEFFISIDQQYTLKIPVQFFSGAVLIDNGRLFTIFLDGVDITPMVLVNTLQVVQQLSQASTASFGLWDKAGVVVPQVGQDVQIYELKTFTRIFGGSVEQPVQTAFQALPGHLFIGSGGGATSSPGTTGVGSATGGGADASGSSGGVQCSDYSTYLSRRYVGKQYPIVIPPVASLMSDIFFDIIQTYLAAAGFTFKFTGDPGTQLGPLTFPWVTIQSAFNQLSSSTGWEFSVDPYKVVRIFPPGSGIGSAPFNITDDNGTPYAESLTLEYYRSLYRNRQGVMAPSQTTYLWTDIFSGVSPGPFPQDPQFTDGIRQQFFTSYLLTATPQITVNGVAQSVGQIGPGVHLSTPGFQWFWLGPQSVGVFQNTSDTPLSPFDVLEVSYPSSVPTIYWVQDDAQIAERAAIEGGDGIYEDVEQAPTTTSPEAIFAYAAGLLQRYGSSGIPFQISYATRSTGLMVGQVQDIVLSNPLVNLINGIISALTISDVDGEFLTYSVTVIQANYQGNWTQFFQALITGSQLPVPANFVVYTWTIAPTVSNVTNTGANNGTQPGVRTIQNQAELLQSISVTMVNPVPALVSIGVLWNGAGVLSGVSFRPNEVGTQVIFPPIPTPTQGPILFKAGDVLQTFAGGGFVSPGPIDVIVEVTTSIVTP